MSDLTVNPAEEKPVVYYQTVDGKIWCGEVSLAFDDGTVLVDVIIDGDGNRLDYSLSQLVTPVEVAKQRAAA